MGTPIDRPTLLIIDDEPNIVDALERILRKDYHIVGATSGKEALKALKKNPKISLILCDQRMPNMTGVEVFEKAQTINPHAVRLLLTGYSDIEAVIDAINKGHIYKYLGKPWENQALRLEIKKALEFFTLQKTIREQNAELKALDKAKDQFLMLISHELNTPLTTILSYSESYLRGLAETKGEKIRFVERIREGALRLKELTSETLDLITAKVGKLKLTKTPCQLDNMVQETLLELHEKASDKKITLENSVGAISFKGDASLIKKNIQNLLDFALKMAHEKTNLWLTSKKVKKKKKNTLVLTIAYRGESLTAAQRKKIFEPFLVVGDILSHKLGAGLGLPICKVITDAHKGTLSIAASKVGKQKETLITLTLPLH